MIKAQMTVFDRLVGFFNPQSAIKRQRSRIALSLMDTHARKYDAASMSRRTQGWHTGGTSANSENQFSIQILRNRCRDLVRNDPYAASAIETIESNVVGYGINLKPVFPDNYRPQDKVERAWKLWSESTACDIEGMKHFHAMQALVMRCVAESGECLVRRVRIPNQIPGVPSFQLHIMEPDFLDDRKRETGLPGGGYTESGIEFDKNGRRVAYWIYNQHPGDYSLRSDLKSAYLSTRVSASDIKHIYDPKRPGQIRGVPFLSSVAMKIRDFNDYEDAQLLRQKIAACFAAFIYDSEAPTDVSEEEVDLMEKIEPGAMQLLPPGKKIEFGNPPAAEGYADYSKTVLRGIAAGTGVTYEGMTGDYSNVNFSSGRMGWIEFQRKIDKWRWNMLIPGFCDGVWQWFVEDLTLMGIDASAVEALWTAPRREMIDPVAEIGAYKAAVRSGFMSLSDVAMEMGRDPKQLITQVKADFDLIKELGLTLDIDPSKITLGGLTQPPSKEGP